MDMRAFEQELSQPVSMGVRFLERFGTLPPIPFDSNSLNMLPCIFKDPLPSF